MNFSNLLMLGIEDTNMQKKKKQTYYHFLRWKYNISGVIGLSVQI